MGRPLRTIAEIEAAGLEDGRSDPPLTQAQANYMAALLAPYHARMTAAQPALPAA